MPRDDQIAPGSDDDREAAVATPTATPTTAPAAGEMRDRGTVWMTAGNGLVRPVRVRVGVTDGMVTEVAPVEPGTLPDGSAVVTGEVDPDDAAAAGTANPFVPQFGKRKK